MSALLAQLRRHKENRGMMAELRCALVRDKRHRAWPALSRLNVVVTDEIAAVVAGLYATHSEESRHGNFGSTCHAVQNRRGESADNQDTKVTPTERRFQHLLAAEKGHELYERVTRFVMMAKSQEVSVNYAQLEKDLGYWSERTRAEWAEAFWTPTLSREES